MNKIMLIVLFLSIGIASHAQEKKKSKNATANFNVSGNCEMCQKRIEKAAFSVKGVKSANWHVDHKDIHVIFDENKCSLEEIKKAIANVGHDTNEFKASDKVYEELHGCCQYERL